MIQLDWIFDEKGYGKCQKSDEITLNDGTVVQFEIVGTCWGWADIGSYESEPSSGIEDVDTEIEITAVYNSEGWELTDYNEQKIIKSIKNEIEI